LAGHSIPITGIVTESRFDTSEAVPVLKFRAVRPLTQEEWEAAKAQSQTEDARQAVDFKMVPSRAETGTLALPMAFKEPEAVEEPVRIAEPVKRAGKAKAETPAASKDVSDILSNWATDDDA
jgi:hypothetical protein